MRPIHETRDPGDPPYRDEDDALCPTCGAPRNDDDLCADCDAGELAARAQDAAVDSSLAADEGGEA